MDCIQCGKEVGKNRKKFCSRKCQDKLKLKGQYTRIINCAWCGVECKAYTAARKYCSDSCRYKAKNSQPKRKQYYKDWRSNNPQEYKPQIKCVPPLSSRVYFRFCDFSGELFTTRNSRAKISPKYRLEYTKLMRRDFYRKHLAAPKILINCSECNKHFKGINGRKFCSHSCIRRHYNRIHRKKQKAASKGVKILDSVNPMRVFETYNWTCQECRTHTPREEVGLITDTAPTMDHITPLSRGGEHSYKNTQLLCRKCNVKKGIMNKEELSIYNEIADHMERYNQEFDSAECGKLARGYYAYSTISKKINEALSNGSKVGLSKLLAEQEAISKQIDRHSSKYGLTPMDRILNFK